MAGELSRAGADIAAIFSPASLARAATAAGADAEKSATDAANETIGGGSFSGLPGKRLNTSHTVNGNVCRVDFVPAGLWLLAELGRRRGPAKIVPITAKALSTPYGPRRSVKGSTSRGKRSLTIAYTKIEQSVPEAVGDEFDVIITESGF